MSVLGNSSNAHLKTATSFYTVQGPIGLFQDAFTRKDLFESHWRLPQEIGDGFFWKIEIQPGFDMYIMDCQ